MNGLFILSIVCVLTAAFFPRFGISAGVIGLSCQEKNSNSYYKVTKILNIIGMILGCIFLIVQKIMMIVICYELIARING